MTTNTDGAPDPQTGRFAIWIAGGLGIAAIVAYGSFQAQQRMAARERAPEAADVRSEAPAAPGQLVARVHAATRDLDVAALATLDRELETSAARTTKREDTASLRVARASALGVRALEAAIRAHRTRDAAATAEVATTLAKGRELTDALTKDGIQPAAVGRIEARLDLAEGRDITVLHPVVLMPDYPDAELRLAALSRPLFVDAGDPQWGEGELADLTAELRGATPQTGLSRLLLAMALEASGDGSAAESEAQAVLSQTPGQPLAVAMQAPAAERGTAVEPPEPEAQPEPAIDAQSEPEPAVEPEPVVEPTPTPTTNSEPGKSEPKPQSDSKAKPKAQPKAEPKPAPASKPKNDGTKKPASPKKPRPKKTKPDFATLLADGCKLVRGGNAAEGFKILKEAHDLQPGGVKVTLCMAQAQDKLGRAASALALVDRVINKAPKNKTALLLAARLEAAQGNRSTAEQHYRKILEIDPKNAKAKKFLGVE
jgi:tetratricopeptide (TPR) repeat protein